MRLLPVFIIPSQVKRDVTCSMSVLQGYLKGDLQKKQLIASIVEQFKLNLENTRAPLMEHLKESKENRISIIF